SQISGLDSCEAGSFCRVDMVLGYNYCQPFCGCSADTPTCDAGEECFVFNMGVLPLCYELCDPLDADPCGEGRSCALTATSDGRFICLSDASGGGGGLGMPCTNPSGCAPGLACEADPYGPGGCGGADYCCTPLCDLDEPECPAGTRCVNYFAGFGYDSPVCLEDVGFCVED